MHAGTSRNQRPDSSMAERTSNTATDSPAPVPVAPALAPGGPAAGKRRYPKTPEGTRIINITPAQKEAVAAMVKSGRLHFHSSLEDLMAAAEEIGYGFFEDDTLNPRAALKRGAKNLRNRVRADPHVTSPRPVAPRKPMAEAETDSDDDSCNNAVYKAVEMPPEDSDVDEGDNDDCGTDTDVQEAAAPLPKADFEEQEEEESEDEVEPKTPEAQKVTSRGLVSSTLRSLRQPLMGAAAAMLVAFELMHISPEGVKAY